MTFSELTKRPGEWLRGAGPECEVVLSSRIRLARNLAGHRFLGRCASRERREIQETVRQCIQESYPGEELLCVEIDKADPLDRQVLVERHLISRQHADGEGCRAVVVSGAETWAVMINEEDHIRLQSLRSGLQLEDAWAQIGELDDMIDSRLQYAYSSRLGYLTACPTNVGTGLRVSVMLHLPGLRLTGEIERMAQAAKDMRLAVRGLFGEGTEALGDFYQVSNQVTLGKTEEQIIHDFKTSVIPKIVEYEKEARRALLRDRRESLDDKVWRAMGALRFARLVSTEETLSLLSHLRMGVHMKRLNEVSIETINELFLQTQPAHLQRLVGKQLNGEQRGIFRAEYIRQRLAAN